MPNESARAHTAPARTAAERRVHNPVLRDTALFLETAEETGGRRTLIEFDLQPGGGNDLHVHRAFEERFEAVEGELQVQVRRERRILRPGESATIPRGIPHCFRNPGREPIRFRVEIRPSEPAFEQALWIGYRLAADGLTDASGVPGRLWDLAVLTDMAATDPLGPARLVMPILRLLARSPRGRRVRAELVRRYWTPDWGTPAPGR